MAVIGAFEHSSTLQGDAELSSQPDNQELQSLSELAKIAKAHVFKTHFAGIKGFQAQLAPSGSYAYPQAGYAIDAV